jgi:outer membrane protein
VARERGFSMVLTDPNIVGYIDETADLTDLIIQDMNRN